MVVIVISLLMATMQTGADAGAYELVAADVESVLHAATRPPTDRTRTPPAFLASLDHETQEPAFGAPAKVTVHPEP